LISRDLDCAEGLLSPTSIAICRNDPVHSCSGANHPGGTHEHRDIRRKQTLDQCPNQQLNEAGNESGGEFNLRCAAVFRLFGRKDAEPKDRD